MPNDNPNPKSSFLNRLFSREKSELSYEDFNLEVYRNFKDKMEEFRKNCFGEPMEKIWESLESKYLPESPESFKIMGTYDLDTDGNATPTRLYAQSSEENGLQEHSEPLVAVKLHTGLSILSQRTPAVLWDSYSKSYQKRAEVLEALRKSDWLDDQTRSQYVMLLFFNLLYGTAYWRRFYDKSERKVSFVSGVDFSEESEDKYSYSEGTVKDLDQTVGESLSPLDVWIDPGTAPFKPRSMRYVRYDKVYDYQTFLKLFKGVAREKDLKKVIPKPLSGYTGDDLVKCEFFEHVDLDLYYVVANDEPILKRHLPQNHKQLSVKMLVWLPRGRKNPFGLGPIEMMSQSKDSLDRFLTMTMNQVKFSIYKAGFYTGSLSTEGGDGSDIRIRPDRMYKTSDPKAITFMDVPGPGEDAWRALEDLRRRIDDASGINKPLGGEITKSTAYEVDLAKDAALSRLGVPVSRIVDVLRWDAEITFELQKQYYSLPDVRELIEPGDIRASMEELSRLKSDPDAVADFTLWFDESNPEEPRVFRGDYRRVQLASQVLPSGEPIPGLGSREQVLTPEIFDWRGKLHVAADSVFSLTPTLERGRKLEFFNLVIPLFQSPPEMVAKPARELAKLYGIDYESVFPEEWIAYLTAVDSGIQPPPNPMMAPQNAEGQPAGFEQQRPEQVVTNVGGQKDLISSQSERIGPV